MKRKLLLSILAAISVAFLPLAATSQIASEYGESPAVRAEPSIKYEVFAGYGYTSLNQVNQSRHGLQGVNLSITRDWGRFFGITADGAFYSHSLGTPEIEYTTFSPSVDAVLFGPVFHAHLFRGYDGFVHVLLGGEHTGGVNAYPKVSFAGGFGIGIDYKLKHRFSLRVSGDDIMSSFVAPIYPVGTIGACTATSNCSAHEHGNSRVSIGLVYKF